MFQLLEFLSRQSTSGSRANVLGTSFALFTVTSTTLAAAIAAKAPSPVIVMIQCFVGVAFSLCCGGYVYFALKNPESLRSERFTLATLRIEKGLPEDIRPCSHQIDSPKP